MNEFYYKTQTIWKCQEKISDTTPMILLFYPKRKTTPVLITNGEAATQKGIKLPLMVNTIATCSFLLQEKPLKTLSLTQPEKTSLGNMEKWDDRSD